MISAALYFFKDDLIKYAVGEVNKNLKAKVYVGKIDLSFWSSFPAVSIDFNSVFIPDAYPDSKMTDTLFYGDRLRLKFNLWDVWNEEYKVKALEMQAGKIYVKYNEKGEENFDILKPTKDSTDQKPFAIDLKYVHLENVRFAYINLKTEQTYVNHFDKLDLSGSFANDVFDMSANSLSYLHEAKSGNVKLLNNVPLNFNLTCSVNKLSNSVTFPKADVYLANIPLQFHGKIDTNKVDFQLVGTQLPFEDVINKMGAKEIQDVKQFKGKGLVNFDLTLKGDMNARKKPLLKCKIQVKNGALTEPNSGLQVNNVQLDMNYLSNGRANQDLLEINKLHFNTAQGAFDASLIVKTFDTPQIIGAAHGIIDLAVLHQIFPLYGIQNTSGNIIIDGKADLQMNASKGMDINSGQVAVELKNAMIQRTNDSRIFKNIQGEIDFTGTEAILTGIALKIQETDLNVNGVLKNLVGYARGVENLDGALSISSNQIIVDDLANTVVPTNAITTEERNWVLPNDISAHVLVNLKKVAYQGHVFSNISSDLIVANRILDFQQFEAQNAGSKVQGRVSVHENTPENYILKTTLNSSNIYFSKLFKEWQNFDQQVITGDNISGLMEAKLQMEAPFDGRLGIVKHLIKADVSIKIKNGRLTNVKTFKEIIQDLKTSKAKLLLSKQSIAQLESKLNDISFQTLENTFTIRDGVLQFPKMEIKSTALNVFVAGVHSFDNQIDYRFDFKFRDLKEQGDSEFGTIEDDGTGMRIFMRMSGDLDNPLIEWDKEAKKEQALQNREDALNEAKSIFKSEFGIGKRDTSIHNYNPKVKQREEIILEYDTKEENPKETPKQKENKLLKSVKEKTNKWKEAQKKESENEFEIGD